MLAIPDEILQEIVKLPELTGATPILRMVCKEFTNIFPHE